MYLADVCVARRFIGTATGGLAKCDESLFELLFGYKLYPSLEISFARRLGLLGKRRSGYEKEKAEGSFGISHFSY